MSTFLPSHCPVAGLVAGAGVRVIIPAAAAPWGRADGRGRGRVWWAHLRWTTRRRIRGCSGCRCFCCSCRRCFRCCCCCRCRRPAAGAARPLGREAARRWWHRRRAMVVGVVVVVAADFCPRHRRRRATAAVAVAKSWRGRGKGTVPVAAAVGRRGGRAPRRLMLGLWRQRGRPPAGSGGSGPTGYAGLVTPPGVAPTHSSPLPHASVSVAVPSSPPTPRYCSWGRLTRLVLYVLCR